VPRRSSPVVLALLAAAGCATAGRQAPLGSADRPLQMEEVVIRSEPDPLTGLDAYDARELLELGNAQFAEEAYDRAVKVYGKLLEEFPDSQYAALAAYNRGLGFEKLVEWEQAAEAFERVITRYPESSSHKDAYFRAAFAYSKLKRWDDVANTFYALRERGELEVMEELEARVGQAVGMFMQEEYATAEVEFMRALKFHEEQENKEYLPADYFIGQSRFYLGEIYARWFEERALSKPSVEEEKWIEAMGNELEEKCELLLRAQSNFIRTIRIGHTGWATAAGYRIGSLYETLHSQMLEVPVPESLSEDAKVVYREELRKRVRVLVKKAIRVYEMSKEMAERVGEKNEWVERTNASLQRMKDLYRETLDG
jgi:tetratricopeptide (TPR) repeat protein